MRAVQRLVVAVVVLGVLAACGGGGTPATPRPTPSAREAQATQTAIVAAQTAEIANKRPCLVDPGVRDAMRVVADELESAGLKMENATQGMQVYQVGLNYGLLADCRAVPASPVAGIASPVACIANAADIALLRKAGGEGMGMAMQLVLGGADEDLVSAFVALNQLLLGRATELEIACGLRPPASPTAATPVGA